MISGISLNDSNKMVNKEEILDRICAVLEMSDGELAACTGRSLLSTARQVISAMYPNEMTIFAEVKKEHIQAVAGEFCSLIF